MQKPASHRNPACLTQVVLIWNNYLDKQFLPDISTRFPMGSYITSVLYETIVIYKEKVTGFIHPISKVLQWSPHLALKQQTLHKNSCYSMLFSHGSTKRPYMNVEKNPFSEHSRKTSLWLKLQFSLELLSKDISDGHCRQWFRHRPLCPVPASWALLPPAPHLRASLDGLVGMEPLFSSMVLSFVCPFSPWQQLLKISWEELWAWPCWRAWVCAVVTTGNSWGRWGQGLTLWCPTTAGRGL